MGGTGVQSDGMFITGVVLPAGITDPGDGERAPEGSMGGPDSAGGVTHGADIGGAGGGVQSGANTPGTLAPAGVPASGDAGARGVVTLPDGTDDCATGDGAIQGTGALGVGDGSGGTTGMVGDGSGVSVEGIAVLVGGVVVGAGGRAVGVGGTDVLVGGSPVGVGGGPLQWASVVSGCLKVLLRLASGEPALPQG